MCKKIIHDVAKFELYLLFSHDICVKKKLCSIAWNCVSKRKKIQKMVRNLKPEIPIIFNCTFLIQNDALCTSLLPQNWAKEQQHFSVEPNFDSAFWRKNNSVKAFNTRDEADLTFLFLSSYFLVKLYNFLWSDSETIIGQKNDRKVLIKREMMHFLYCTVGLFLVYTDSVFLKIAYYVLIFYTPKFLQ